MVESAKTAKMILSGLLVGGGRESWFLQTKGKREAPPAHVEGEFSTFTDRRDGEEEPN